MCSSFAKQIAESEARLRPHVTAGNAKVRRDFSDFRDIVRGYQMLMEGGKPGEFCQLCSGRAVSIEETLRTLLAFASTPVEVIVDQSEIRGMEAGDSRGDASNANQTIGWTPEYDWERTLRGLAPYWRQAVQTDPRSNIEGGSVRLLDV